MSTLGTGVGAEKGPVLRLPTYGESLIELEVRCVGFRQGVDTMRMLYQGGEHMAPKTAKMLQEMAVQLASLQVRLHEELLNYADRMAKAAQAQDKQLETLGGLWIPQVGAGSDGGDEGEEQP